jgi:hypothetical protein
LFWEDLKRYYLAMSETLILDNLGPDFLEHDDLAKMLGFSPRKLARLQAERRGPPRIQLGRKVIYHLPTVRTWLITQQQEPVRRRR